MRLVLESENKKLRVIVKESMEKYDPNNPLHMKVIASMLADAIVKYYRQKNKG